MGCRKVRKNLDGTLVPLLSFDKQWTDEELYARYGFDDKEIDFIESMIRPMNLGDGNE